MNSIVSMTDIIIHSTTNMITQKKLTEDTKNTLKQMVTEDYSIKEIADFLEGTINFSVKTVAVIKEFNAEEILKELENMFT